MKTSPSRPRRKAARPPAAGATDAAAAGARLHQREVMHRLRRVEGQIRGVVTMIEQEQSCDAIAQQLSAARKALDRAFYTMLACSLEMEVGAAASSEALREGISEKIRLLAKYA